MMMQRFATFAVALLALTAAARAEDEGPILANMEPTTRTECGACHQPYPAEFLPAQSWTFILDHLDQHFGQDASLGPEQLTAIRAYLTANAGKFRGVDAANPPLRITELPWFRREHGARRQARAKADPKIGSMSNCAGCHSGFN